jgi:hypothetical protein
MPAGNYVKVSDMWRETLAERAASGADYTVALELLAMARWGAAFVKLSNVRARALGVSPSARGRSLERLTRWGLIKKTRVGRRKSPVLRIDWLAGRQPGGHVGTG